MKEGRVSMILSATLLECLMVVAMHMSCLFSQELSEEKNRGIRGTCLAKDPGNIQESFVKGIIA